MGGVIDMREFSGLKRIMPWTFRTFMIGSLALAGFPLFAGFWSKDEIIHHAWTQHWLLGLIGSVTAVLTAFYTFRMVFMAFFNEERVPPGVHAHESGKWILVPLCILAIGAFGAGYVNVDVHGGGFLGFLEPGGVFAEFLDPVMEPFAEADPHAHGGEHGGGGGHLLMYISAALAIAGIFVAWWMYVKRRDVPASLARSLQGAHGLSYNKYYVDEIYDAGIVRPMRGGGRLAFGLDEYFIDGLLWLITAVPRLLGFGLKSLQTGSLQGYAVTMTAGVVILVLLVILT